MLFGRKKQQVTGAAIAVGVDENPAALSLGQRILIGETGSTFKPLVLVSQNVRPFHSGRVGGT